MFTITLQAEISVNCDGVKVSTSFYINSEENSEDVSDDPLKCANEEEVFEINSNVNQDKLAKLNIINSNKNTMYALEGENDYFAVHKDSGKVEIIQKLEDLKTFAFKVRASDKMHLSNTVACNVIVKTDFK